jgi:putative endonuclease
MDGHDLGIRGERRVAWWFFVRCYRVAATRYRVRGGELDLVAVRGRTLHVVEVKTRRRGGGDPLAALTVEKRRRIVRATRVYLQSGLPAGVTSISFDLAEVRVGRFTSRVCVHFDAFRADDVASQSGRIRPGAIRRGSHR